MFVRGTVIDIEHNSGEFDGKPWATRHIVLSTGERVKIQNKEMDAPDEGATVEALVTLNLKHNPNNLLQPYRVDLLCRDYTVLTSADGSTPLAAVPTQTRAAAPRRAAASR